MTEFTFASSALAIAAGTIAGVIWAGLLVNKRFKRLESKNETLESLIRARHEELRHLVHEQKMVGFDHLTKIGKSFDALQHHQKMLEGVVQTLADLDAKKQDKEEAPKDRSNRVIDL